jgi:hypothetical protein
MATSFCKMLSSLLRTCSSLCLLPIIIGLVSVRSLQAESPATVLTAVELAAQIDQHVDRALEKQQLAKSPPADDAEFLRRVCLDVTGVIPSLSRVEAFFADTTSDKRVHLIAELLRSEEYARHMTDQWRDADMKRASFG